MKEFFGFGGYTRAPEGFLSWQHILFVSALMVIMASLAVFLGRKYRNADNEKKRRVLIWTAILIDSFEIFKIVLFCIRANDPMNWKTQLPLFLCSIQLIVIPVAAFAKGRIGEAARDFVFIFGLLGALSGTYGAGNIYGRLPVLSFDAVISGITHAISGFASLFIAISGMTSMKKKNIPITLVILFFFCTCAMIANKMIPHCNYMFLVSGEGTPYEIFYALVNGSKIFYPAVVIGLFILYMTVFYGIYFLIRSRSKKNSRERETVGS